MKGSFWIFGSAKNLNNCGGSNLVQGYIGGDILDFGLHNMCGSSDFRKMGIGCAGNFGQKRPNWAKLQRPELRGCW
jgi:hypothetical protein